MISENFFFDVEYFCTLATCSDNSILFFSSFACHSATSVRSTFHPCCLISDNALRSMTLRLYIPPTLLGNAPSESATSNALVCSATRYTLAFFKTVVRRVSTGTSTFLAMSDHCFPCRQRLERSVILRGVRTL